MAGQCGSAWRLDGVLCHHGFDAEAAVAHGVLPDVQLVVRPTGDQIEAPISRGVQVMGESPLQKSPGGC